MVMRFDVRIPSATGIPADTIVNTWHFIHHTAPVSDYDNVRDMLLDFYDAESYQTYNITHFMTEGSVEDTWDVVAYDLDDPEPRAPHYESSFTVTGLNPSNVPLVREAALVLSIQAEPQSGVPQARRRNRKYLGPFGVNALGNDGRPHQNLLNVIAYSARDLLNAAQASATWGWRVYSPTTGLDLTPVGGWVDNAWDTQRRRGWDATSRINWTDVVPEDP